MWVKGCERNHEIPAGRLSGKTSLRMSSLPMCEKRLEGRTMGRLKVDLSFKTELIELPAGPEKLTIASIWGS